MLNFIRIFTVVSSIYFLNVSNALAYASHCYNENNKPIFKVESDQFGRVTITQYVYSSLGNYTQTFIPCYNNADGTLLLGRSSIGRQFEIAITPGTNRQQGFFREGAPLNKSNACSNFGKYTTGAFSCDKRLP